MDIAGLIAGFSTSTSYIVKRRAAATFHKGIAVPGTLTTITVVASVSPAAGNDLLRLPELRRAEETRVLFTATRLYVGGVASAYEADRLTIEGEDWEVIHVETWINPGGTPIGYKCTVQRP